METILKIESAVVDLGENPFLSHRTHEIKIKDKVIGHAMVTLYNFKKAAQQNTAWKWLAPKNSYLSTYQIYLFDPNFSTPILPEVFLEDSNDSDTLAIIDEITLEPFFQGRKLEAYVLSDLLALYEEKCDIILFAGHQEFAERIGYDQNLASVLYCQLGFVWVDDFIHAKFKSISMDNLDEIPDLKANLSGI